MGKPLHDTHFHLDLFNDEILSIANKIEKEKIYTIAVTNLPPLYTEIIKKLKDNYNYIRPALGFHPELIGKYHTLIPKMWELLPHVKYIGEVGLDYKVGNDFKTKQVRFFENLIEKCDNQGGKILTIHSRRSADDVISIIGRNFNSKYILHWYSGSIKTLKKAVENGAYFSVNYSMTKSDSGKKIIAQIPMDRLLLESDGPFIKFNKDVFTPLHNKHTVVILSKALNISLEQTNTLLFNNFRSLITL
ncbi:MULTISPECIES: Qat anti-phage system TatD family nuclease QatD [Aequorivita]|uniref:TatD family hydrolase n=1 Tax=Aequorivita iocasae TaxID=2803865 RepID=A0ABX7DWF1_9FLAO|nr:MULTISPECIES: Qat anti-phage system TatD family nuclease QatD [Aequorivita]QQX78115.1 TatD family hydrolase [Aequorivita iocasae]UCA57626.1 TatD family hydrolase [Aequorivita sp. F7]